MPERIWLGSAEARTEGKLGRDAESRQVCTAEPSSLPAVRAGQAGLSPSLLEMRFVLGPQKMCFQIQKFEVFQHTLWHRRRRRCGKQRGLTGHGREAAGDPKNRWAAS